MSGVSDGVLRVLAALDDIPLTTDTAAVRRRSRDFFWYSPVLNAELHGKSAEAVVTPRHEDDVVRIMAACAQHRVAVTPRGGGTGNYGQAVPIAGGIVLDMSSLSSIEWHKPGLVRVGAGAKMVDVDRDLVPAGWELRMHPSTKRSATVGGFVAGGSGGIGSVTYGGLRQPGNVRAARVVTLEATPRVLDLRDPAVQAVNHAYGTTGVITALEMPLAPAFEWIDVVVAFDTFDEAAAFGYEAACADGIAKKLLTPIAWPIPAWFTSLKSACPDGQSILIAMVAAFSLESFKVLLGKRGTITSERPFDESPAETPLYEYTWNHTTLHALKVDRSVTYLQCLFPADRLLESVRETANLFGDEVLHHLEFMRVGGRITASGLPVVRYTDKARLYAIIEAFESRGIFIANPHVMTLEDGGRHKRADSDQLAFKHEVDPMGLLNPGKMRTFVPRAA